MLNELFTLSSVMNKVGIEADDWHREYSLLPRQPCYRVWISAHGAVCGLEELDQELIPLLRKYGNNQRSFPAFNIKPLYRIVDEEQKKQLKQIGNNDLLFDFQTVKSWCIQDNWHRSLKNIDRSLSELGSILSSMIHEQGLDERNNITHLASVVKKLDGGLRTSLEKYVFEKMSRGEDIALLLKILFHSGDPLKDSEKDDGKNISVILDIDDWQEFNNPVTSETTTRWLNDVLQKNEKLKPVEASFPAEVKDAFGAQHDGVQDPMPKVKLHGFDVSLRAMFRDQLCQYRYGAIDSDSFPISKANRANVKQSLEWIAHSDKEGTYWKKADEKEIVFIYPSKIPKTPLKFASVFGGPEDSSGDVEKRFAPIAREMIKTLEGLPLKEKPDNIQIFSIRKMDKARSKVIFTRILTPEWFIQSANDWQEGCTNLPPIESIEAVVPFPLQIAKVVNDVWKQNGELANADAATVRRMQHYQGMELLLDSLGAGELRYYLHIIISNSVGLISHFGNEVHKHYIIYTPEKGRKGDKREQLSRTLSIIGLLLYKGGFRMDDYMENAPYLVGQLLKISDELHAFYCKVVRNGDVPLQLAGNSVFMSASETPAQALAQLSARMNPYIAWAKQYRSKNITCGGEGIGPNENKGIESWRAAYYLTLYEDVATILHTKLTESTRFNDFDKAQMFIGYLAKFPKRERRGRGDVEMMNDRNLVRSDLDEQ